MTSILLIDPESKVLLLTGGGAWGTALAIHAAKMGHETLLWAREPEVVASVNGPTRENTTFLKVCARSGGISDVGGLDAGVRQHPQVVTSRADSVAPRAR